MFRYRFLKLSIKFLWSNIGVMYKIYALLRRMVSNLQQYKSNITWKKKHGKWTSTVTSVYSLNSFVWGNSGIIICHPKTTTFSTSNFVISPILDVVNTILHVHLIGAVGTNKWWWYLTGFCQFQSFLRTSNIFTLLLETHETTFKYGKSFGCSIRSHVALKIAEENSKYIETILHIRVTATKIIYFAIIRRVCRQKP